MGGLVLLHQGETMAGIQDISFYESGKHKSSEGGGLSDSAVPG